MSKVFLDYILEQFFLTVGQNNFGNKIPFLKIQLATREKLSREKEKNLLQLESSGEELSM